MTAQEQNLGQEDQVEDGYNSDNKSWCVTVYISFIDRWRPHLR